MERLQPRRQNQLEKIPKTWIGGNLPGVFFNAGFILWKIYKNNETKVN